jgi:hypothetical protein
MLQYKIIAVAVVLLAAFGAGYMKGSNKAQAKIQQYEQRQILHASQMKDLQIALENEKNNIKEKIVVEYVDKVQTIKEKHYVYVDKAKEDVPSQYNLSNGWVYLHDHAAGSQSGTPDPARTSDATASDVKDNQALAVVVDNYGTCKQNAEQLVALQDYFKKVKEAIDKANANPIKVEHKNGK